MKKWGVRLIGMLFLFGAITTYLDIITQRNPPRGFLGMALGFYSGPSPEEMTSQLDLMALVGLCIYLYVAYNLLTHKNQGRIGALVVLWLSVFQSVFGLFLLSFKNHVSLTEMPITFELFNRSFSLSLLAWASTVLLLYAIQIYFLMRKDVKMEFQSQGKLEPKPATE